MNRTHPENAAWVRLAGYTVLAAYLYIFNEWLFVITMPAYLNSWSLARKIELYLLSSALLAGAGCLLLGLLYLLRCLPGLSGRGGWLLPAATAIPAFLAASLALMMVDNFAYTMLRTGIVSTVGAWRAAFALLFACFLVYFYRKYRRGSAQARPAGGQRSYRRWLAPGLGGLLLLSFAIPMATNPLGPGSADLTGGMALQKRPNILFITSDGLEAGHMSLYGYERDTTPSLRRLAETSLVAENAFTNAGRTALTGRYATATRILYTPYILQGDEAYLHLPGILRSAGYHTEQFSYPYYADLYSLNLLNGFDRANGRTFNRDHLLPRLANYLPLDFPYYMRVAYNRFSDRLLHIFFLKRMANANNITARNPTEAMDGGPQVEAFIRMLDEPGSRPFFVQMHLLGTHGPNFHFQEQVFSKGQDPATYKEWAPDFYDDSILGFDQKLAQIIQALQARGLYEDTLIIIGSDHAREWSTTQRLPLLIHFPGGEHAGRIRANVDNLDIAPTVLDYLGVPPPAWMQGRSLIDRAPLADAPLFIASAIFPDEMPIPLWVTWMRQPITAFHPFETLDVIYCERWYTLKLVEGTLAQGPVEGSTAPCQADGVTEAQVRAWMDAHLEENGYPPQGGGK